MTDPLREAAQAWADLIREGMEAFRLTREYVGEATLPAVEGWSWFDWCQRAEKALAAPAPALDAVITITGGGTSMNGPQQPALRESGPLSSPAPAPALDRGDGLRDHAAQVEKVLREYDSAVVNGTMPPEMWSLTGIVRNFMEAALAAPAPAPALDPSKPHIPQPSDICSVCGNGLVHIDAALDAERRMAAPALALDLVALIREGMEAFRLTREYVGEATLPAVEGWSWFDWCQRAEKALAAPAPALDRHADAEKLRVLATWFDAFDDWREATGKIAPGIAEYREVQADLRRIADAYEAEP